MSRFSYKTLILILLFLLIPIVLFLRISQRGKQVSAEWFNDSWNYRQRVDISISSSSTDFTSLDTLITIDTSSLIAAGKMQNNCADLRFTNISGDLLPYYIDSGCNTTTTKIWIQVDLVPKNTTSYTTYVYYGNPSAPSVSDSSTFNLYNGLIGYWNFNENVGTSTTDLSANTNTAIFGTGAPTWTTGKYGIGLSFNGSTYTESADTPSLSPGGAFTFSLWIYPSSTCPGECILFNKEGEYEVKLQNSIIYYAINNTSPGWAWVSTGITVSQDTWTHIVLTYNSTSQNIQAYKDGALIYTRPNSTGSITDMGNALRFAARGAPGGPSSFYSGLEDDIRFYNRALSSSEVTQLYSDPGSITLSSSQSKPTISFSSEEVGGGPIAYWKFDEGVGTTAFDSSSNNINASLSNTTWNQESSCISGKCLQFNGTNSIASLSNIKNLDKTGFTVNGWIKVVSQPAVYSSTILVSGNGFILNLAQNSMRPAFQIYNGSSFNSTTCTNVVPLNQWAMLTLSLDASSNIARMYLNGEKCTTDVTITDGMYSAYNNTMNIGGYAGSYHNGSIDDIKVYPYARTADQIKADYAAGLAGMSSSSDSTVNIGGASTKSLSDGLVGYWKFDEGVGTTIVDSSGNSNLATFGTGSSAPSWTSGKYGIGLSFNASNSYATTTNMSYSPTPGRSGCAWIKPTAHTNLLAGIFRKVGGGGPSIRLTTGGLFNDRVTNTAGGVSNAYQSSSAVPTGAWSHVCVVWESPGPNQNIRLRYYINSTLDLDVETNISDPNGYVGTNNTNPTWIGSDPDLAGRVFNGLIDEVRLYNRALSPTEVKSLYEYAPGPVGYWKFEEGSGSIAYDSSGNNKNGTMNNFTSSSWVPGKYGKALQFNGTSSYISGFSVPGPYQFTWEAWIKPNTAGCADRCSIIDRYFELVGGSLQYYSYQLTTPGWHSSASVFQDKQWQYATVSYDGSTLKLYRNGIPIYQTNTTATGNMVSAIEIGANATSRYFDGSIDEVKIYNYARTQKQILEDMAGSPPPGSTAKVSTPLVHYKFDEGFGTTVNNSGSAGIGQSLAFGTSAPSWSNSGKNNKALNFSGTGNYLIRSDNDTFELHTGGVSASAWVKIQNPLASHAILVSKGGSSVTSGGYWWGISTNGKMDIALSNGTNWLLPAYSLSNRTVTDNTWHHLVFTWDPTQALVNFYVDSQLDKSIGTTASTTDITGTANLLIGGYSSPGYSQNGLIDEVKIYNYALSAEEVKQDYNQGSTFVFGTSNQTIGATTTSLDYCVPGDTSPCSPPVAEWKFEEGVGTTAYDTSGNNRSASFVNYPNWITGKVGKAINLTNNSYLKSQDIDLTPPFTLESWVYCTDNTVPNTIISKTNNSTAETNYWMDIRTNGNIYFGGYGPSGENRYIYTSNIPISNNTWYHITGVDTGSNRFIYVNGNNQPITGTTTGDLISHDAPTTIGNRYPDSVNNSFNGKLDQVRIYNYARTPAQIAWDYNKGAPVGHWKLDECQGTTVHDSGNNNHGVLSVGASGTQTSPGTCTTSSTAWGSGKLGKINSSLNFDGSDDVITVPDHESLTLKEITISAWIKNNLSGHNYQRIVDKVYNSEYALYVHSGNIGVGLVTDLGSYDNAQVASNVITDTNWHNVVFTWTPTSGAIKIYVDGTLKGSASRSGNYINDSTNPVLIGNRAGSDRAFNGQIDDVRIYNYALTSTQIKTLYNNGSVNFR